MKKAWKRGWQRVREGVKKEIMGGLFFKIELKNK